MRGGLFGIHTGELHVAAGAVGTGVRSLLAGLLSARGSLTLLLVTTTALL